MTQLSIFERARLASQPADPFDALWSIWPRKLDKQSARKAHRKALKKVYPDVLEKAVRSYAAKCKGKDQEFIPYFATWLNKERWLDEEPKTAETAKKKHEDRLDAVAFIVKKKIRTTNYSDHDIIAAYRAGKVTAEECKAYGVRV